MFMVDSFMNHYGILIQNVNRFFSTEDCFQNSRVDLGFFQIRMTDAKI